MQPFLTDFINTLTNRTAERVDGILEEAKVGKEQVKLIAQRLSDFREFSSLIFTPEVYGDIISRSVMSVNIRDLNIQLEEMYRIDNQASDLIESSKSIFSSQISALENEITALEKQVQNYGFLLADGGAYDYAYMEPFSDSLNRDFFDWDIPDRGSQVFGLGELAEVRPDEGVLCMSPHIKASSIAATIVKSNASALVATNNGIENAVRFTSERGWRYVIASPNPVTSSLPEAEGTTGAQVMIDFVLNQPTVCNEIRITPFSEHPIQILKVFLYESLDSAARDSVLPSEKTIDKPFSVQFSGRTVAKFSVLINQPIYDRAVEVVTAENPYREIADSSNAYRRSKNNDLTNSKSVPTLRLDKDRFNHKRYSHLYFIIRQRMRQFRNRNLILDPKDINGIHGTPLPAIRKDRWGDLVKIPLVKERDIAAFYGRKDPAYFWNGNSKKLQIMSNMILNFFEDRDSSLIGYPSGQRRQDINSNIFQNSIISVLYGDKNLDYQKIRPLVSFILSRFRDVSNFHTLQQDSAQALQTNANLYPTPSISGVSSYNYKYFLGLEQISIGYSSPGQKAVFVTKPFDSVGDIGELRLKSSEQNIFDGSINGSRPITSVEYSVSNVTDPKKEEDWIPVLPIGQTEVSGERFFPDSAGLGLFRFPALRNKNIYIYKNNIQIPTNVTTNYVYDSTKTYVIGVTLPTGEFSGIDIYTVDYTPSPSHSTINFANRGFDQVPLINAYDQNGSGEGFSNSNNNTIVTLSHYPYVDEDQIQSNISSGQSIGPYQPIVVSLLDGTIANNYTTYANTPQKTLDISSTAGLQYLHKGNVLIFNHPITQNFRVYYQYLKNNTRVRVVIRVNSIQFASPKVDFVQIKAKTRKPNRADILQ